MNFNLIRKCLMTIQTSISNSLTRIFWVWAVGIARYLFDRSSSASLTSDCIQRPSVRSPAKDDPPQRSSTAAGAPATRALLARDREWHGNTKGCYKRRYAEALVCTCAQCRSGRQSRAISSSAFTAIHTAAGPQLQYIAAHEVNFHPVECTREVVQ